MNQMNQNTDGLIPLNELAHKNRFSEMIRTGPRDLMSTDLVLSKSRRDFSPTPEKNTNPCRKYASTQRQCSAMGTVFTASPNPARF